MSTPLATMRRRETAPRPGVLHLAIFPRAGVWSHIKELVLWQAERALEPRLVLFFGCASDRAAWLAENGPGLREIERAGVKCSLDLVAGVTSAAKGLSVRFGVAPRVREAARRLIGERRAHRLVIHCHTSFLFGYMLPFDPGVPCSTTVVTALHGVHAASASYDRGLRNRLYRALARRCMRHSTLVSVDETGAANCARYFGVDAARILVIHNGISIPPALPLPVPDGTAPVRFGFIGRLDRRKGWDVLCDAFERGVRDGAHWQLLLAGNGVDEHEVKERVASLGSRARFLGHLADPAEAFYPQIDVLVLPSEGEGLSMVVLEAGARGIPIIATGVGGLPLIVLDGRTGRLVAPGDRTQLLAAMRAMDDPSARREMSSAVRTHVAANFSIDACGARWLEAAYGVGPEWD